MRRVCWLVSVLVAAPAWGATYKLTEITVPGAKNVNAAAIDVKGDIALSATSAGYPHGYVLYGGTRLVLMKRLPQCVGVTAVGCAPFPSSMNKYGEVAGYFFISPNTAQGFVWHAGNYVTTPVIQLGTVPQANPGQPNPPPFVIISDDNYIAYNDSAGACCFSVPYYGPLQAPVASAGFTTLSTVFGVNAVGTVIGQNVRDIALDFGTVLIKANGTQTELLPPAATTTPEAYINNQGDVAGDARDAAGNPFSFFYHNGKYSTIMPPAGLGPLRVQAVSDTGHVAGTYLHGATLNGFVWSAAAGFSTVGSFGGADLVHLAINAKNQVVISDVSTSATASYLAVCTVGPC